MVGMHVRSITKHFVMQSSTQLMGADMETQIIIACLKAKVIALGRLQEAKKAAEITAEGWLNSSGGKSE